MARKNRPELVEEATGLGIGNADDMTVDQLHAAIAGFYGAAADVADDDGGEQVDADETVEAGFIPDQPVKVADQPQQGELPPRVRRRLREVGISRSLLSFLDSEYAKAPADEQQAQIAAIEAASVQELEAGINDLIAELQRADAEAREPVRDDGLVVSTRPKARQHYEAPPREDRPQTTRGGRSGYDA